MRIKRTSTEGSSRRNTLLIGHSGVGKEQPVSCVVQTPDGPRRIGDLAVGDKVFGSSGQAVTVTGVFPQGVKDAYKITFRDGTSTRCGLEHLWLVGVPKRSTGWRIMTTQEIIDRGPVYKPGSNRFKVPLCLPVEYEQKEHFIDPYVLGALIGDGSLAHDTPQVSCSDADSDIIQRIEALLPSGLTMKGRDTGGCNQYSISDPTIHRGNRLKAELKRLGLCVLSGEKFIPKEYLRSSVKSRTDLLAGLMDTDGSSSRNRIRFHTTSERLADDVCELVRSLGAVAIKTIAERGDGKATEYHVNVRSSFNPFYCSRKAAGWKFSTKNPPSKYIASISSEGEEEQVCIMVDADDHLYLTDDFIVTHNTRQAAFMQDYLGKGLILSGEAGLLSLSDKDIDFVEFTSFNGKNDPASGVYSFTGLCKEILKPDFAAHGYKWLMLDSLTELSDMAHAEAEADGAKSGKANGFAIWTEFNRLMMGGLKFFRSLPYDVIVTALVKEETDENGKTIYLPLVKGQALQRQIAGIFDCVFGLVKREKKLTDGTSETTRAFITDQAYGYPGKYRDPHRSLQSVETTGDITDLFKKMDAAAEESKGLKP